MRILHIIRGLANSSGTTHIVNPMAKEQGQLGHDVRVLHVAKAGAASVAPDPEWVKARCFELTLPFNNPGVSLGLARALPQEVLWAQVVHIHAVWNFPSWWGMRCAYQAMRPFMVAPQGSFDPWAMAQNALGKRIYGPLTEMPLLRKANCLQALTRKEALQFRAVGLDVPAVVIPNGIPAGMFVDGRVPGGLSEHLGLPAGSRTILFLSRVHPKKGLDLLLHAFRSITKKFPDVYLVVAGGDGGSGYLARMMKLAGELDIGERLLFVGEVAGEAKRVFLRGADAWALLSRSEGLPVAAIEALGAGLPCVLTDECNLPDVEDVCAGWTVPTDVEAAASALSTVLGDPAEAARRGEKARLLVREKYTWPKIALETIRAYRNIAADGRFGIGHE